MNADMKTKTDKAAQAVGTLQISRATLRLLDPEAFSRAAHRRTVLGGLEILAPFWDGQPSYAVSDAAEAACLEVFGADAEIWSEDCRNPDGVTRLIVVAPLD